MIKRASFLGIFLIICSFNTVLAAEVYNFQFVEFKHSPKFKNALSSKVHIRYGQPSATKPAIKSTGRSSVGDGTIKAACQRAAIISLKKLQKYAAKKQSRIIYRVHSPSFPQGHRYACSVGLFGASVILSGSIYQ